MELFCPHCAKPIGDDAALVGATVTCPHCQQSFNVPPPQPVAVVTKPASPPSDLASPPPIPSVAPFDFLPDGTKPETFAARAKNILVSLWQRTRAANKIIAKLVAGAKIHGTTLPACYKALGEQSYKDGKFREEFSANFGTIDCLLAEVAVIQARKASLYPPMQTVIPAKRPQSSTDDQIPNRLSSPETIGAHAPPGEMPISPPKLHPCPDCGKMVSLRTVRCPDCVAPVKAAETLRPASSENGPIHDAIPRSPAIAQVVDNNSVRCPKCGCTQLSTQKRGMDAGGALVGALLLGPLGLLAGAPGANKVVITCLKCGHQWTAG